MDSVINTGGEFKMISRGTSMLPMLRDGIDTVVIVKANAPLKTGDVPLYIKRRICSSQGYKSEKGRIRSSGR